MKKILTKLFILLFLVVGIANVKAATITEGVTYKRNNNYRNVRINDLHLGNLNQYNVHLYTFTGEGNTYNAFCMDPQYSPGSNYKIERILASSNSVNNDALDYGILEIMKPYYDGSFTFTSTGYSGTISGDELYAATSIAIRTYTLGLLNWGGENLVDGYYSTVSSALVNEGFHWAAMYNETTKQLTNISCSGTDENDIINCYVNRMKKYSWYNKDTKMWVNDGTAGNRVIYAAQQLFKKGVEAALNYKNGNISIATSNLTIKNSGSDGNKVEYINAVLDIKNFNDVNGYIRNVKFVCDTCSSKGITFNGMEYQNASGNWVSFNESTNLIKLVDLSNGKRKGSLQLRFIINKNVTNNCSTASYKITYDYYDPDSDYIGALLKTGTSTTQRFFIITKNNGEATPVEKTGTIKCAKASCDTDITIPVCSADETDAISTVSAPENIKSCIIDNADEAGNTYQLPESRGGVDNSYCKIFCKEDYSEIKLNPEVPNVVCGGYFSLTSHVKGKKDCYTGGDTSDKSIDKEQYLEDIKNIQIKMINAYDKYLMATNALKNITTDSCDCCSGTTSGSYVSSTKTYTGVEPALSNSSTGYYTTKEVSHNYEGYGETCSKCSECCTNVSPGETCTEADCTAGTSKEDVEKHYKEIRDKAIKTIKEAYSNYQTYIKSYNACTTGWTNNYEFNPTLKFFYNEYNYNNTTTPYYDLLGKLGNDDAYYLHANGVAETSKSISVCTGTTDEKYETCSNNWKPISSAADNSASVSNEYNYKSAYSSVFSDTTYTICTVDSNGNASCSSDTKKVSQATFVKKTVEKEQSYKTPSYFYQIESNGRVTINQGYVGNKIQLEQLIEKLPISTNATGGGIFKLMIEDLGEFYDTGKLGRIFDFDSTYETSSVAYAKGSVNTFTGEYICHYSSPCKPRECPNCEFICEGNDCSWRVCPECNFTCVNCLFDLGQLQATVKTISSTTVQTVNRNYGYNWITSSQLNNMNLSSNIKSQLSLVTDKADATITEIEKYNEKVFNTDKIGDSSSLAFSVRLTPEMISDIKEYNRNAESVGGYANDSLTCSDAIVNGVTYKNIYCYSDFIDEMLQKYNNNFTVPDARLSKNSSSYWTLWTNYVYNEDVIGGPSWK